MDIYINNETGYILENYYDTVRSAVLETLLAENVGEASVSVTFVTTDEMRRLNKRYRNVDEPTDVLSFPLDGPLLGDILICFDRAMAQAREYGNTGKRETAFLTVHGTLHLLGYDHADEACEKVMINKQKEIMKKLP